MCFPLSRSDSMIDPADLEHHPRHSWRTVLSWLFGLAVLATVILVASRFTEIARFAELARAAEPHWLLVAVALQAMTYLCAAGVWYGVLRRAGVRRSFWSIVPLGLAKLFTDQVLPAGGIGGTLLVLSGLERRGVLKGIGMAALLVGMVAFYAAYLMAVLIALVILYDHRVLNPLMISAAGLFAVVAFGIPVSVLALQYWSRSKWGAGLISSESRWLGRVPGFTVLLAAIGQASPALLRDPGSFLWATVLQLGVFVLDSITLWVMLQAIGAGGSPATAAAAFMMASLAATIGPVPLGLGTFEAVCVAVLHVQALSVETALMATLLLRGFTFWLPMIPGLILAHRELRFPSETAISGTGEISSDPTTRSPGPLDR